MSKILSSHRYESPVQSIKKYIGVVLLTFFALASHAEVNDVCEESLANRHSIAIIELASGYVRIESDEFEGQLSKSLKVKILKDLALKHAELAQVIGEENLQKSLKAAFKKLIPALEIERVQAREQRSNKFTVEKNLREIWTANPDIHINIKGSIETVLFSPNEKQLLVATGRGVDLYDVRTGASIGPETSRGLIAFSPNAETFANLYEGQIQIISAKDLALLETFPFKHTMSVFSIQFSPDGKKIVTAGWDKHVRIFDVDTKELVKDFTPHEANVGWAVFSPDGNWIASGGADNIAIIWNAETGEEKMRFAVKEQVTRVQFSTDGKLLMTQSPSRDIRIWNAETGEIVKTIDQGSIVQDSILLPDSQFVASVVGTKVQISDVTTGFISQSFSGGHDVEVWSIDSNKSGTMIATGDDKGRVIIWEKKSAEIEE